jgi:hypothetical protein
VGYTSFGYANPMRKVLSNILLTRSQLQQVETAERIEAGRLAGDDAGPLDGAGRGGADRTYEVDVVEVVEQFMYRPAYAFVRLLARLVTRLQSGRLDAYMAYMLVALLAAIALVAALA